MLQSYNYGTMNDAKVELCHVMWFSELGKTCAEPTRSSVKTFRCANTTSNQPAYHNHEAQHLLPGERVAEDR